MGKLTAKFDNIIVKQADGEKQIGGIIIPDTGKEKSNQYVVVNVGPGQVNPYSPTGERYPMEVEVGEILVIPKAVVSTVDCDGEEYGVCRAVEARASYTKD